MPSDNAAIIGSRPAPSVQREGQVDTATTLGMMLLYTGVALSMASLFWPAFTASLLGKLLAIWPTQPVLHTAAGAVGAYSGIAAALTQSLWVIGAVLLCVQPFRMRQWNFLVPGVGIVLSSLLPLWGVSGAEAMTLRIGYTVVLTVSLGCLEGITLCKAVLPWYWPRVWRGEMGPTALAIVGSEILSWGYSLFAVHSALGWVGLVAGSAVMMRFSANSTPDSRNIAGAWYRLNTVYVVAGVIQLAFALHV